MAIALGKELNRKLVKRLGLGGIAIAAILGSAVFGYEMERIDDSLVDEAVEQARALAPSLPDPLDASTAAKSQTVLEGFLAAKHNVGGTHFGGAEIYALDRTTVAEALPSLTPKVITAVDRSRHVFPATGDNWYVKHVVGGEIYLLVMTGLTTRDGRPIGYFEGIYHVAPERIAAATQAGLRTTLSVIFSVLATTLLLYPIIRQMNRSLIAGSHALLAANLGAIEMLGSAIAKRDSDTNSHNYRVTLYAVRLAEAVGLPHPGIRSLIKGAFLHDVGKLAIPDSILLKPGRLNDGEFDVMRTHVTHGLDVVERFEWLRDAADVVGCHHEKFDGSGYTAGLAGEDIPLTARIFAIADVFDALTSQRPYKEPLSVDQATAIMLAGRGSHFDPALLDVFFGIATGLYAEFGGREDSGLEHTLRHVTIGYFVEALSD
ncbi:Response regulator [Candidatus Terasakiella magnetica]|nr:Response regulator [Candidatus Terasakiella magnetica]